MAGGAFVDERAEIVRSFLADAAHMPGGHAAGVSFPATLDDVVALVRGARRVLAVGAQSSLTGGATPRGDLVISTRALTDVSFPSPSQVKAGAGVPLGDLQRRLAARGLCYPPVPTFDGAFVGGTVATNAAGAATFKYGTTREWVDAITVVLADGSVLSVGRGDVAADASGLLDVPRPGAGLRVRVPGYTMPDVPKLSAGYFARPGMDLIDLFIGSEGTLGIIVDATLRVVPRPSWATVLVACASDAQALAVTGALRRAAAWRGHGVLDVSAVELIDHRAARLVADETLADAGVARIDDGAWLVVQIEIDEETGAPLDALDDLLRTAGVVDDPAVALPGDERGAARLLALREAVPAAVNARVARAQAHIHPGIHKVAGDMIVPFARLQDALALYGAEFERRGLDYAVWGHASDGNLHPNVLPRSFDDVARGEEALIEIARQVIAMGGAPLAEHGVGRSPLKQRMLKALYGEAGIDEMRAVKRTLDPEGKLARGVIFPE